MLEKSENRTMEDLRAVCSSVAQLKPIKPNFYSPPSQPIFVSDINWVGMLMVGMTGGPTVAAIRWWSTGGGEQ